MISFVTYLTQHFLSSASVCNYISEVRFMHRELGLIQEALASFPVASLLCAADITMQVPPLRCLPILLPLLHQLCLLSSSLGGGGWALQAGVPHIRVLRDVAAEQFGSAVHGPF